MRTPVPALVDCLRRPARYGAVGLLCAALTFVVILSAKNILGLADAPANLVGYAAGYGLGFALNGRWTFGYRGRWIPAFGRHLGAASVAYAANLAVVLATIRLGGLDGLMPHLIGAPAYTVVLYLLSRHVVFRTTGTGALDRRALPGNVVAGSP